MLFSEKVRELREKKHLLQRQIAATLQIDNAMYCKIEKGDRAAKRDQVISIAKILGIKETELLTLWLADKINNVVADEKEIALRVLDIVTRTYKNE